MFGREAARFVIVFIVGALPDLSNLLLSRAASPEWPSLSHHLNIGFS